MAETAAVAARAPVYLVNSVTGATCRLQYLKPGLTVTLLGSSGAGKSTLLNRLAGCELQRIGAIRSGDDRGRHTTTRSDLFRLPGGALVIDTPGLRELQLWGGGSGLSETFEDLEAYAARCRFNDCRHRKPGCAVQEALRSGTARGRYEATEAAAGNGHRAHRTSAPDKSEPASAIRRSEDIKVSAAPAADGGLQLRQMRSVWLMLPGQPSVATRFIAVILKAKLKELLIGRKGRIKENPLPVLK